MIARGELEPDPIEPWWERRREHELTPDYLGRVLDEAGLPELARNARAAHYDDFHAPAEVADGLEILRLVRDLRRAARAQPEKADRIAVIENATRCGEFDATKAESDRWGGKQGRAGHLRRTRRADGAALSAEGWAERPVPVRLRGEVQEVPRRAMIRRRR